MKVAVVVAHPDDEVLWPGGTLLMNPDWEVFVAGLCRGSDPDRAPRFFRAIEELGADGALADLDDGPDQMPLDPAEVRETLRSLLPDAPFGLVFTHGPRGEYTRHRRHEEVCRGTMALWDEGSLRADELRLFAYHDGGRAHLPRPEGDADHRVTLPDSIWERKVRLLTGLYGFSPDSWEVRATPRQEAFRTFGDPVSALAYARSVENPP